MAGDKVVHIQGANWKTEVLEAGLPVVVDFWASWCGPCRMIAPILDELSEELAGKIKVAKVDVDQNQDLAANFGIRSIPTLLVFQNGTVQEQMVGAMSKTALVSKLQKYLQ
jgi:thioredoxin 1